MRILIRGGRVIDPATQHDAVSDVLIEDGTILAVEPGLEVGEDTHVVDAKGLIVTPGLIDMHTHLREPGQEYKEDIASGSKAAARGGFTSIACMPNTTPALDSEGLVASVVRRGNEVGLCRVHPIAAITKGLEGRELTEMNVLKEAGAVGFSDDGLPVESSRVMRRALEYSKLTGCPVISHSEEKALSDGGHMHEGEVSTRLGIPGIPSASEDIAVARECRLAEITGGRVHICHVSSARSVEILRDAKRRGVAVTGEVTPHHLALTHEAVMDFDSNTKMNPPLRSEEDRQALIAGLKDGTLDAIATDHAPHADREKLVEFDRAPFGILGFQTALPVSREILVDGGHLDWPELIERFTVAPARILGLEAGTLRPGAPADVTVTDPDAVWTLTREEIASKSRNSPWLGRELKGRVVLTLLEGRATWEDAAAMRPRIRPAASRAGEETLTA